MRVSDNGALTKPGAFAGAMRGAIPHGHFGLGPGVG